MRDNLGVEYTDVYGDKLRTELGQCPNPHKESKLSLLMLDRNLGGGGKICRRSLTPVGPSHISP